MYYLSDKKGAGLQIETLIHYVLNSILLSLCHISVFCLCFCFCLIFALVFVLFGFAQVAGSSFRESAQVSNFLKMWQKHKIRHRRDCSSRSRSSKFEICGSSTALQALLLQHHLGLKIFTLITKHRQESKSSLQYSMLSKEPWTGLEHYDWQQVKYLAPIEMVAHDQPSERVTWLHLTKREKKHFFNSLVEVPIAN